MKRYTDKERLDWLQNHSQPISVEVTVNNRREWFCWYDVMKEPHHSRTIRGAIDAAMRCAKPGGKGKPGGKKLRVILPQKDWKLLPAGPVRKMFEDAESALGGGEEGR